MYVSFLNKYDKWYYTFRSLFTYLMQTVQWLLTCIHDKPTINIGDICMTYSIITFLNDTLWYTIICIFYEKSIKYDIMTDHNLI